MKKCSYVAIVKNFGCENIREFDKLNSSHQSFFTNILGYTHDHTVYSVNIKYLKQVF